jgi:hypothetical protein
MPGGNVLHEAYAANADGLMNAGFGTTSELHYLQDQAGHQGKTVLMPVEDQHEQMQNADLMKQMLGDKIMTATTPADLRARLDDLVANRTKTSDLEGLTMNKLVTALENPRTNAQHMADLANGAPMTPDEARLHQLINDPANVADGKGERRLVKLLTPALEAAINGDTSFDTRMAKKYDPQRFDNVAQLQDVLADPAKLKAALQVDNIDGPRTKAFIGHIQDMLTQLQAQEGDARKTTAQQQLDSLGKNYFNLGY